MTSSESDLSGTRKNVGRRSAELIAILALLAVLSVCNQQRLTRKASQDLGACKANLRNLATACEMYSTDNFGRYPHSLDQLVPEYLPTLPHCPTGAPHYAYEWAESQPGPLSPQWADAFSICCQGVNHGKSQQPENFPQYCNSVPLGWGH